MKKSLFLWLLLISLSCASSRETKEIYIVDMTVLHQKVIGKEVQLVDIRTPKEYQAGFIDDAINIDFSDKQTFKTEFLKLDRDRPVYIYCYSGGRSRRASRQLGALGFKKIYDFKGGYKAWSNSKKKNKKSAL